eukprot:m.229312 g.229312  ORF g.229312 m.229312 type:complete len:170 (+) comp13882_c0_seq8:1210-1719(+)
MDCEAGELSSWTKEEGASNRQEHCPDVNCRNCFLSANGCEEFCIKTGILDIFGFECFDFNSFEQLLINLANERLQQFFNDHIFKMELDEYEKEGIDGSKITYEDNADVLEMFLARPRGLLSLCDEEALFPKATTRRWSRSSTRTSTATRVTRSQRGTIFTSRSITTPDR